MTTTRAMRREKQQYQHQHRRVVVPNVGHDHSMMFQSIEGINAIYT